MASISGLLVDHPLTATNCDVGVTVVIPPRVALRSATGLSTELSSCELSCTNVSLKYTRVWFFRLAAVLFRGGLSAKIVQEVSVQFSLYPVLSVDCTCVVRSDVIVKLFCGIITAEELE